MCNWRSGRTCGRMSSSRHPGIACFCFFDRNPPGQAWGLSVDMANLTIQELDGGAVFTVKVVPGSSGKTRICGLLDGMLKIKISAAPEKGKANRSLIRFLAEELGVKNNEVSIISGVTGSIKRVQVSGISAGALIEKLNLN
ncbi:MAG: hypothetical protein CEE38_19320 [Planctomycetes bacterium B3_Pla]|nr:MAG: hypothetical protein CEE38_19320 [Planctomycetes bacterium B3_Pla]